MSPARSAPALRLERVRYAYPGRDDILRGIDFDVPAGRLTVVLGANGSGKTTLLRIAAGLVAPGAGSVLLADGTSATAASKRGRIGYIPQQLGLVRNASALENARMGSLGSAGILARIVGAASADSRDRAIEALDAVGLHEKADIPVKKLSGGERQRVAIARTLVQEPEIIVADELIASLDAVQAYAVMEIQRHLRKKGVTMLMSLHQIDVALANADLVAFLSHGKLSPARSPEGLTMEEARSALAA